MFMSCLWLATVVVVRLSEKAAKPETTGQDSSSAFVSVKPLDVFNVTELHVVNEMF